MKLVAIVVAMALISLVFLSGIAGSSTNAYVSSLPGNVSYWLSNTAIRNTTGSLGGIYTYYLVDSRAVEDSTFGIGNFPSAEYLIYLAYVYNITHRSDINARMNETGAFLISLQNTTGGSVGFGGFSSDQKAGIKSTFYYSADTLIDMYALSKVYTLTGSSNTTIRTSLDMAWFYLNKAQHGNLLGGIVDKYYGGFMTFYRWDINAWLTRLQCNDGYGFGEGLYLYYQISNNASVNIAYTDWLNYEATCQNSQSNPYFHLYFNPLPYGDNAWHDYNNYLVFTDNQIHTGYSLERGYQITGNQTLDSIARRWASFFYVYPEEQLPGAWPGYTNFSFSVGQWGPGSTYLDRVVSAYAADFSNLTGVGTVEDSLGFLGPNLILTSSDSNQNGGMLWTDSVTTNQESSSVAVLAALFTASLERAKGQADVIWSTGATIQNVTYDGIQWKGQATGETTMVFTVPIQPIQVVGDISSATYDSTNGIETITTIGSGSILVRFI